MSAILKIGNDFLCLFRREVGTRCKDHQRLAVIRDIRTQKVQVRRRDICFCEELRDGIIQRNLIVSGCDVHRRFRTVGHIGNGACDLAFSVEALAAAVAVGRGIRIVDLIMSSERPSGFDIFTKVRPQEHFSWFRMQMSFVR